MQSTQHLYDIQGKVSFLIQELKQTISGIFFIKEIAIIFFFGKNNSNQIPELIQGSPESHQVKFQSKEPKEATQQISHVIY